MAADTIRGPSLPPRVRGDLVGSLTVLLRECTVDGFARIQFWGDETFADLRPCRGESAPIGAAVGPRGSAAVEYPLVGGVLALSKYLEDASPLRVIFLRRVKCRLESQTERYAHSNDIGAEEEVEVGRASILDLGAAELLKLDIAQDDTHQQMHHQLSLCRKLKVVCPDQGANRSNVQMGEALFELIFRVTATLPGAPRPQDGSIVQNGVVRRELPLIGVTEQYDQAELSTIQESRLPISRQPPPFCGNESKCSLSLSCDLTEMHSDLPIDASEQQSLLEELLDLCTDDMTLPTVDTTSTSVDPTDMWISRILAGASSPTAKEFPSLVSAGSNHSVALREVRLLKLEVDEVTLISSFADKINGKHDFFLRYNLPPRKSENAQPDRSEPAPGGLESPDLEEFVVCEQFGKKARPLRSRAKSITQDKSKGKMKCPGSRSGETSLLTSAHSNSMEVEFNDDDFVRQWLGGTINFTLLYCLSKPAMDSKLPRVAKLASKKRESNMVSTKICLAKASLRLSGVLLSDALANRAKLDLLLSGGNELLKDYREGVKVGSISVNLGLHRSKGNDADHSIPQIPPPSSSHDEAIGAHPPPALTPHPISVFLSSCIGAPSDGRNANVLEKHSCSSDSPVKKKEQCTMNEGETNALKPVQPPPIWLYIKVNCISNLRMGTLSSKSGSLKMDMSCSEPILPLKSFTHQKNENEAKVPSLEPRLICSEKKLALRTKGSNEISTSTSCSWQVALDAAHKDKPTAVTFHIMHCANSGGSPSETENILVGLVKIPFLLGLRSDGPQRTNNYCLPNIAANGRFDVLHPESRSPIGQVQATVAAGMLRQIRGFPAVCLSASKVQRWWRRKRSNFLTKEVLSPIYPTGKNRKIRPDQKAKKDFCPDFDVVPTELQIQHEKDDLVSSPDSLFEEWSQQSLHLTKSQLRDKIKEDKDVQRNNQENPRVASELDNEISAGDDQRVSGDAVNDGESVMEENAVEESKSVNSSNSNECQSEAGHFVNSNTKVLDRLDILVNIGAIRGLQEILTAWSGQGGISLLPASGVFVSCSVSQNNETMAQQDELHQLCSENNICHSKVISTEKLTRDLSLCFESTLSMFNHEKNTEMILSQALVFKLWFVPIVTTTIAGMIGSKRTKDFRSLKGCSVISIAKCPLYHLYTLKGCYEGRVPVRPSCFSQKGDFHGYITVSISRIDKVNDAQSSLNDVGSQNNQGQYPAMSSLKPLNLEVSFDREQGRCVRQGIDPPEEKFEQSSNKVPGSSKRKVDQSSAYFAEPIWEQREIKRHRVDDDGATSTVHVESNGRESEEEEEEETLCPSDTSENYDYYNQDSDSDETLNYRSLSSVMESLENINSKLTQASAFDDNEGDAAAMCNHEQSSEGDAHGKDQSQPHSAAELNFTARKPDAAEFGGHSTDPPEEKDCSVTYKDSRMRAFDNTGKTCEQGSSAVHTACQQVDATTNTCTEYLSTRTDDDEKISDSQANDSNQDGGLRSKGNASTSQPCQPKDDTKCPDCEATEQEQQTADGPQETPTDRIRNYLSSGGRLGALSNGSRFLKPAHSYSWRARHANVLSPMLKCMSPTRFDALCREAGTKRDKRAHTSHFGADNQDKPISFGQKLSSMSEDKDRLERIFSSRS